MHTFPVLVRELRRLVRLDVTWMWMVALALVLRVATDGRANGAEFAGPAAIALAMYWAHRTMSAELEGDTIEHLGTLPIGPFSLLMQVGIGSTLAACLYAQPLLWLSGRVTAWDFDAFARAACLAVTAGWMGAMGGFQFGGSFLTSGFHMTWMGVVLTVTGTLLVTGTLGLPLPVAAPFGLAGGATLAALVFAIWRVTGGHWIESLLPDPTASIRAAAEAETAVPSGTMSLTPDCVPPLAWHELRGHPFRTSFIFLFPAVLMAVLGTTTSSGIAEAFGNSLLMAGCSIVPLVMALTVSSNVAQLRRQGLWDDLTVTPVSAHAILAGHVGVPIVTLWGSLALWLFAWCGAAREITLLTWAAALALALLIAGGALAGFLGGALTTGWRAGLLSLAIGAVAMVTFTVPLMAYTSSDTHPLMIAGTGFFTLSSLYAICIARVSLLREGA